jgi:hypothetical protein
VLLTALLLACASTGPPSYWTAFTPSYYNFQRHFDERGEDLDPIEGIWSPQPAEEGLSREFAPGDLAIVRDSSYEAYEFVGVRKRFSSAISHRGPYRAPGLNVTEIELGYKGEIFIALRRVEGTSGVYEYTDAAVLRGEKCPDEPRHGVYVITADGELYQQRSADEVYEPAHGWIRKCPPP